MRAEARLPLPEARIARREAELLVGGVAVLLGPVERDARGLRAPLGPLRFGPDQENHVAPARGDLYSRVREHALHGAACNRSRCRLRPGAAESVAQQRG